MVWICGLIHRPRPEAAVAVPLKSVSVHAEVRGWTVGVMAELSYHNSLNESIECQFVFPLSDKAAVYRLDATIAGNELSAECRPRKEAEESYKEAVESGRSAVLLEDQQGSPDVFRILLGNLPANQDAKVTIGYVQPAERDSNGNIFFTLPSVLNPRYVPREMLGDAEKVKEKFHISVPYVSVSDVSYSMTFDAKVNLGVNAKISEIKPANTADQLKIDYQNDNTNAVVTLEGKFIQDHDFGLTVTPAEPWKPMVFIEPGKSVASGASKNWLSYDVACAWFEPALASDKPAGPGVAGDEFWFVVDRSGSMQGSKIEDAKTALLLFVKSLPNTCKFNIVGFGSTFSALFPEGSVNYAETSVKIALEYASEMSANLGGTEILRPLEYIYSQAKPTEPGARQFIVLLTDGEVGNTDAVISLARQNAATSCVFSVGIGEGASTALVNGLARVSGGISEFVRNSNDRLQAKVISLLKAATNPAANNLALNWAVNGGNTASTLPKALPTAVYQGRPVLQFALIERHQGNNVDGSCRLTAVAGGANLDHKLIFSIPSAVFSGSGDAMPLHRLAAKARLQEVEDTIKFNPDEAQKTELVAISVATGVLCSETALVAVDSDTRQPAKDGDGRPRFIDVARPTAYRAVRHKRMALAMVSPRAMMAAPEMQRRSRNAAPESPERSRSVKTFSAFSMDVSSVATSSVASLGKSLDDMELLISNQNFNGSWSFNADLVRVVSSVKVKDEATLRSETAKVVATIGNESVLATLVALAVLRRRFAARRDEWELIEGKAIDFLTANNLVQFAALVDTVATALAIV